MYSVNCKITIFNLPDYELHFMLIRETELEIKGTIIEYNKLNERKSKLHIIDEVRKSPKITSKNWHRAIRF